MSSFSYFLESILVTNLTAGATGTAFVIVKPGSYWQVMGYVTCLDHEIEVYGLTNTPLENTLSLCQIFSCSKPPSSTGTCLEDLLASWNCGTTIKLESRGMGL